MTRNTTVAALLALAVLFVCPNGRADDRVDLAGQVALLKQLTPEAVARWGDAQYIFTAKLEKVTAGPVAFSMPPIYTHRLDLTVDEVLRGPLKAGQKLTLSHRARQEQEPTFPKGKLCLVTATAERGGMLATSIAEADPKQVAAAKVVCQLPLGWTIEGGELLSPWASLGQAAWPAGRRVVGTLACAKTGRPALLVGDGVRLQVEPVPPAKEIQWTNPDGDGLYKVTVTNTTDQPQRVRALLGADGQILWKESLLIRCQGKSYMIPGAKGVPAGVEPVTLKPGESVSTEVNALALQGPEWPRGGYRIEFQFCLGQQSSVQSFYYMSRHHDKIRQQAQQGP